jgi:nucleotide-binding universal stress UspA family protein
MTATATTTHLALKHVLYLTDFSQPSEVALPFVAALGRGYNAHIDVLHVMTAPAGYPPPRLSALVAQAEEDNAVEQMKQIDSQLAGLRHETTIQREASVWPAVSRAIEEDDVDLIVLGTHGRTGSQKLMLGSVAEEIFRRSNVPVLTIGPRVRTSTHNAARFHRIVLATDFSEESLAAARYAVSLAEQSGAQLLLMLVLSKPQTSDEPTMRVFDLSVAEAIHRLYEIVPARVTLDRVPEVLVEFGRPAERIVEVAKHRSADLIVLGVRDASGRMSAATHLERSTAHKVVATATCPVLTVRAGAA